MQKKLQVFVSSTYLDLTDERQKAVEGILRANHIPAGMELFAPSNKTQWEIIQEWIKNSDVLLLILGGRYGSVDPITKKSYTHLEYECAFANGIPVFSIILNDQYLANKKSSNIRTEVYEHEVQNPSIEQYKDFKKMVMSFYIRHVEHIADIPSEVFLALKEFIEKDDSEYHFRGWIRGDEKPNPEKYSIKYNLEVFLDEKERNGLSKQTLDGYKSDLTKLEKLFSGESVTNIGSTEIKEFLKYREQDGRAKEKSTMEKIRGNLNNFFEWLVLEELIKKNPVKNVSSYKHRKKGNQWLNNKELAVLRSSCETLREKAMFEFFLSTGCHLSELAKVNKSNINWDNNTVTFINEEGERVSFLTENAKNALGKYLSSRKNDDIDFLFISLRKPYRKVSNRGIQDEIERISERAGLQKKITPKTLRHTFGKLMSDLQYPSSLIDSLLGYSPRSMRSESFYKITENNIWDTLKERPNF